MDFEIRWFEANRLILLLAASAASAGFTPTAASASDSGRGLHPGVEPGELVVEAVTGVRREGDATVVTLVGHGFTVETRVAFGSWQADIVRVVGDSRLDVIVPAATAGRMDVCVENEDGVSLLDAGWTDPTYTPGENGADDFGDDGSVLTCWPFDQMVDSQRGSLVDVDPAELGLTAGDGYGIEVAPDVDADDSPVPARRIAAGAPR